MAQFGGFDDSWGLHAIVRGSSTNVFSAGGGGSGSADYSGYNGDLELQMNDENGFLFGDDNLFQTTTTHQVAMLTDHDDFHQLYQPFNYPVWDSSSSSSSSAHNHQHIIPPSKLQEADVLHRKQLVNPPDQSIAANPQTTPKYKRRKNQQKRVVVQSGEGVPSDMWAWRKYGQKPIKGSPYPRSYYRCSSSKSCLAKKQVEQSCTEPGVNIITYTAEHNHSQPIRKNALAGTTRQKFPTQISPAAAAAGARSNYNINKAAENSSSNCNCSPAPAGSTSTSTGGDHVQIEIASNINEVEDGCSERNNEDIKMEEEFFAGLEDLDGLISELELVGGQHQYCSSKMFSMNFYNY